MADQVEKATVIRPALDPSGVAAGAQQMAQYVIGALNQIDAANQQTARTVAGNSAAFEGLKRQFLDGYSEAMRFARAIQDITSYGRQHQDQINLIGQLLTGLAAKYNLTGEAAQRAAQAALTMNNALRTPEGLRVATSVQQQTQARDQLTTIFQQRGQPQPAAPPIQAPPYVEPTVSRRQQQALAALSEGRRPGDDIFGIGTLGYDRSFGTTERGAQTVLRNLQARGLIDASGNLTGATAYQLAGVTPPPGAPGLELTGQQLNQGINARGPLSYADYFNIQRPYLQSGEAMPRAAVASSVAEAVEVMMGGGSFPVLPGWLMPTSQRPIGLPVRGA
jgi:hypothetical protein